MRKILFAVTLLLTLNLFASANASSDRLIVEIKDILDLATYETIAYKKFEIKKDFFKVQKQNRANGAELNKDLKRFQKLGIRQAQKIISNIFCTAFGARKTMGGRCSRFNKDNAEGGGKKSDSQKNKCNDRANSKREKHSKWPPCRVHGIIKRHTQTKTGKCF